MIIRCDNIKGEITSGVIIFIDIDNYIQIVSELQVIEECKLVLPIYNIIAEVANDNNIILARTFGDAFLLYKNGFLICELLGEAIVFLDGIKSALAKSKITFKSSLIAGQYFFGNRINSNNVGEILLCGSTVNYAGKMIKECKEDQLIINWPKANNIGPVNFKGLKSSKYYKTLKLSISKTELLTLLTNETFA